MTDPVDAALSHTLSACDALHDAMSRAMQAGRDTSAISAAIADSHRLRDQIEGLRIVHGDVPTSR